MSVLDEQLKELQGRKLKVEFFQLLKSKLGDITETKYKNVEKEIKDDLFAFIDAQVGLIEGGEVRSEAEVGSIFNDEQAKALLLLADKVINKAPQETPYNNQNPPANTPMNPAPQTDMNKQDKISFALQHQKLGGKKVTIPSHGGATGEVTGLDAPYIGVTLTNGQYVKVLPKDIVL